MPGAPFDIHLKEGEKWSQEFEWYEPLATNPELPDLARPINLTGWTALLMVRKRVADPQPLLVLSSVNPPGGITGLNNTGRITLTILGSQTFLKTRTAVYDLRLTPPAPADGGDDNEFFIEGQVFVDPAVTHA